MKERPRVKGRMSVPNQQPRRIVQRATPSTPLLRISKGGGKVMLGVAIMFDLLPLLLIVGPIVGVLLAVGPVPNGCSWYNVICNAMGLVEGAAGALVVGLMLWFSPVIYTFGSVLGFVLGIMTFVMWFWFKGVNPLRLLGYSLFEAVPVLNILPMFSAGVWRCVKASQKEDEAKSKSRESQKGGASPAEA